MASRRCESVFQSRVTIRPIKIVCAVYNVTVVQSPYLQNLYARAHTHTKKYMSEDILKELLSGTAATLALCGPTAGLGHIPLGVICMAIFFLLPFHGTFFFFFSPINSWGVTCMAIFFPTPVSRTFFFPLGAIACGLARGRPS